MVHVYRYGSILSDSVPLAAHCQVSAVSYSPCIACKGQQHPTTLTNGVLALKFELCRFGAAAYVPALTLDKPLYVRERADGLYRPITYLLSKFFEELFITVFASLILSLIVFYVVQLQVSCPSHVP